MGKEDIKKIYSKKFGKRKSSSLIKECIHPDKANCRGKIIKAHSIQNNRILNRLSEKGMVIMPQAKNDNPFNLMNEYGKNRATTFSGFCQKHDLYFQPIEIDKFDYSANHIFLYLYRAFAYEYHKKHETLNFLNYKSDSDENKSLPISEDLRNAIQSSTKEFKVEKDAVDKAILDSNMDVFESIVWRFDKEINFAASGAVIIEKDLEGKLLQDIKSEKNLNHLIFSIFPEDNYSIAVFGILNKEDNPLHKLIFQLKDLTEVQRKNYINYLIPIATENLVISPSSWERTDVNFKEKFLDNFIDIYRMFEAIGFERNTGYQIDDQGYDLFDL